MNGSNLKVCDKVMLMKITSKIEILNAMAYTTELAESMGFPPKDQILMGLVTEEALSNAWEHGSSTEAPSIEIEWMVFNCTLQLAVKQSGKSFKLESSENSPFSLRGRGLQLIRGIMDELWLEQEHETVVFYMKKHNEGGRNFMKMNVNDFIEVLRWKENITLKNIEQFRDTMDQLVEDGHEFLILNLEQTNYINSAGLGIIADSVMHSRKNHKELVITGIEEAVREIFTIVKFTSFMKIFDSEQEAIDYFMVDRDEKEKV